MGGTPLRRVLVVEDDPAVCALLRDILEPHGYETVCARRDLLAYDLIDSEGHSFSALIVDINLGVGTTGFDVARHARARMPEVPVIYISGIDDGTSVARFGVPGAIFVRKPFDADELISALGGGLAEAS